MHIAGMTVCVDYSEVLAKSLPTWRDTLNFLVVVTAERDAKTQELCRVHGVQTFLTDAFWQDGARFNKGRAMAAAYAAAVEPELREWMLFFDADIHPPADWREQVSQQNPTAGNLYGCYRCRETGELFGDSDIAGFFHLANIADANMQISPIVDTHFYHAGNYDSTFQERWAQGHRVRLPLRVVHYGDEPGDNWFGVGNAAEVREMHRQRRRGNKWQNETVTNNPFKSK